MAGIVTMTTKDSGLELGLGFNLVSIWLVVMYLLLSFVIVTIPFGRSLHRLIALLVN